MLQVLPCSALQPLRSFDQAGKTRIPTLQGSLFAALNGDSQPPQPCSGLHAARGINSTRSVRCRVPGCVQAAQAGSLDLVVDLKGKLLESPVWDARQDVLVFVDTDGQKIHRYDPFAAEDSPDRLISVLLPEPVGFVGLTEEPSQVVAGMERRIVLVDLHMQSIIRDLAITPEEHGADGHRFNDGKPGPAGIGIFGRKHESSESPDGERGRVYRFDLGPGAAAGKLTEVRLSQDAMTASYVDGIRSGRRSN
ncbi:hypothetical protein WJX84_008160 [Apatococcus fuscideae]|uniref:SMP-30/Gluconolactonase/LRE-like region domain-containing protein n=1 Tax=Apatococcus fuscideae TaxID=2026836 RepID=A0AAW1TKQ5_9CHLO